MPIETELKLQIEPRHLARLAGHPLLKRASRRATRKPYSIYYDTPGLDLWRAGVTLRLRRSGKRWTQTVKSGGNAAGGMHQRSEFESALAAPFPDFDALAASEAAAYFSAPELRLQLKPLIITEFTRRSCMLAPADGVAIEASIDHGLIKSGDATAPICELELEVKAGPAWHAYRVAAQLLAAVPLLVEDRSKAQRGFALYLGTPQKPVKPRLSAVVAGMTANDALKSLVLSCLAHYTGNQRGMLGGEDPEYLHQMRVALRRLRSVFSTFAPLLAPPAAAPPDTELREFARILGPARDWDVFVTETLRPVMTRYAQHAGLAELARAAARLRAAAIRRARRAVVGARGQGWLFTLGAWISAETWLDALDATQRGALERPAVEFAREALDAMFERVRRRGRNFTTLVPADLHRLRIAAKKLRYATEFFTPLFDGNAARDYRAVLARLQEALGAYNDAVKTTQLAQDAGRALKGAPANEALGIMLGWSAGTQDAGTRYLKRVWKEFRDAEPYWK
jgi:inorganic triphosphatase YgiF